MAIPLKDEPSSHTAAVVTITAETTVAQEIEFIAWSYDTDPTGGNLKVESPSGTTLMSLDITSKGPGFIPFSGSCLRGAADQALIVTLADGGSGVTGKLYVSQRG